jgi:uncharacterized membrane protein YgaE (UPF0421/DUF939 family)
VLTLRDSLSGSLNSAVERILGTLLGMLLGFAFLTIDILLDKNTIVFYFSASVGSMLVLYLCKVVKYTSISALAVLAFITILYSRNNISTQETYIEAGARILETIIGVVIALLVNEFIFPPNRPKRKKTEKVKENEK